MADNQYIPQAMAYQDLERLQFSRNLRANPEDYSAYVNERVEKLTDEIYNRKRAAFQKAHIDLARYMDLDHNANFYKERAGDVDRLTDAIVANNDSIKQKLERDNAVSRRQFEINEWYNQNKLETLFFLQVFFIVSMLMACVIYLQKTGTLTTQTASLITILLCVVVAAIGVYRYYYTRRIRDARLWHRRHFPKGRAPKAPPKCPGGSNGVLANLDELIPEGVAKCAAQAAGNLGNAEQNFEKWQDELEKNMADYQTSGKPPKSLFGKSGSLGGMVCDQLDTSRQ
jgi:hypothetical protein